MDNGSNCRPWLLYLSLRLRGCYVEAVAKKRRGAFGKLKRSASDKKSGAQTSRLSIMWDSPMHLHRLHRSGSAPANLYTTPEHKRVAKRSLNGKKDLLRLGQRKITLKSIFG